MKVNEVPQERGIMPEDLHEVCYAVDEGGNYVLAESVGWEPKNVANDQAWEVIHAQVADALEKIHAGRQSPLAFHMAINQMNISLLAKYVRMNRWRVKRHLKPDVFKGLKPDMFRRYAEVFGITVEQLMKVPSNATHCFKKVLHPCR
ncbi:MAG: hypothetical protein P1P89_15655 [Desulfobacterales bacterium]|nr:hypothetical protein [Desulfobacterales bacterium]